MPTTSNVHTERVFEDELCAQLEASGWSVKTHPKNAPSYNRALALSAPTLLLSARKPSQPNGPSSSAGTTASLTRCSSSVWPNNSTPTAPCTSCANGFKDVDAKFFLCQFKPAHDKNPKLLENYKKNRLTAIRQLHYSLHNENSIDVVLFVNGLPVATAELKTDLTQSSRDAIDQYKRYRLP